MKSNLLLKPDNINKQILWDWSWYPIHLIIENLIEDQNLFPSEVTVSMKVLRTFSLDDILILPGGTDWSSGSLLGIVRFNTYVYIINYNHFTPRMANCQKYLTNFWISFCKVLKKKIAPRVMPKWSVIWMVIPQNFISRF